MDRPKDDMDLLASGAKLTDPAADSVPFNNVWTPTNEADKPKTLEEWGWLTQGDPPARDAILARLKPNPRDPESPFLIAGKTGMFMAAGGVGKTQTFVQLAIAVATGGEFIKGSGIEALGGGRVLIVCGEEDPLELRRRFWWAMKDLSSEVKTKAAKNITAVPLAGKSCALQEVDPSTKRICPTQTFSWLKGVVTSEYYRLVLLDPASRFMGADAEKDNKAATTFVELLEQLTNPENEDKDGKATGSRPAVLIAHHTNKSSRIDGKADTSAARGASALTDGVRWVADLRPTGDDPDRLALVVTKSNYTSTKRSRVDIRRGQNGALIALTDTELKTEVEAKRSKSSNSAPTDDYEGA